MVVLIFFSIFVSAKNREEQQFEVEKMPTITLINYSGEISAQGWANSSVKLISTHYSENVEVDVEATPNRVYIASHVLNERASSKETLVNYEPRVELESVKVKPNYEAHEFHVTLNYIIVGMDVPQQELTFALLPTR